MADPTGVSLDRGRRFRAAMASPAPLARAFLRYLSTRPDLLPAVDCLELAGIPDLAPPSPWPAVRESLTLELGRSPGDLFAGIEPQPLETRLLTQSHAARLRDGGEVVVKVIRPEVRGARAVADAELVEVTRVLRSEGLGRAVLGRALADFRDVLERELDLGRRLDDLGRVARLEGEGGRLRVPEPHRSLSSRRVLTRDRLDGTTLAELIADARADRNHDGIRKVRRLCRLWLGLALVEGIFPMAPRGRDVLFLEGGGIAFDGGWSRLPPSSQSALLEYLSAVASGDLVRAAEVASGELYTGSDEAEDTLRRRIRHSEPFREPAWDFPGERFVKLVLMHWWEALSLGFRPRRELVDFHRGLFVLTSQAGLVDPDDEPVLEGLYKLRFSTTVKELRDLALEGSGAALFTGQIPLLLSLPQKLDRALSRAATLRTERERSRRPAPGAQSGWESWAVVSAILVVMVVVTAVGHGLDPGEATSGWGGRLAAGLVLLLGALALFVSGRRS